MFSEACCARDRLDRVTIVRATFSLVPCRSVSADAGSGLEADNAPLLQSRKLMGLDKIEALLSKKKTVIVVCSSSLRTGQK